MDHPQTPKPVLEAVEVLGYRPNVSARSLAAAVYAIAHKFQLAVPEQLSMELELAYEIIHSDSMHKGPYLSQDNFNKP